MTIARRPGSTAPDIWEFTENTPEKLEALRGLWSWGLNCDPTGNPWLVFLDLIGWSRDECGVNLAPYASPDWSLGFMELGYLADALAVYADRPQDCHDWIAGLMSCED